MNDTIDEVNGPATEARQPGRVRSSPPTTGFVYLLILALGIFLGWIGNDLAGGRQSTSTTVNNEPSAIGQAQQVEGGQPLSSPPLPEESQYYRTLGDPKAEVVIIEYSDYQCPFCRRHSQEVFPELKAKYIDTGQVYYVFKDLPIASLHPLAYRLHEAAACAGSQDGRDVYWQAHDLIFANAEAFQINTIEALDNSIKAQFSTVGLPDVSRCLAENDFASLVQNTVSEGQALGVSGTPSFFVNGFPITGAQPLSVFENVIELAKQDRLDELYQTAETGPRDGKAQATEAALANQPVNVPLANEPSKGDPNAPIVMVEYSDYQCPFCRRHALETMPQLQTYIDEGKLYYVFKDFPLLNIHPQAQKAHEAARCVRELGGDEYYWQMHDLLFAEQDSWASAPMSRHVSVLIELGVRLGVDESELTQCIQDSRYAVAVSTELDEALGFGLTGTPSFFVNGQRVVGAQPYSVFVQIIESLSTSQ